MLKSESIAAFAPALLLAQIAITSAVKDAENPYFNSKYADLASVIDAVKGPLNSNDILFMQGVGYGQHGVTVETMLLHKSGEWMSSILEIPLGKMDAQAVGSATSYGKRYGLQAMTGLPTADDDGNAATAPTKTFRHTPNDGAWEAMTPDVQTFLTDLAFEVRQLMRTGDFHGAIYHIREQEMDNDTKHALNTRFDSKERAALKKATKEIEAKEKTDGVDAATQ